MAAENAYVAQVAIGANDTQTIKAFREAESFNGPSLIIAYSHCIAHGYDLSLGLSQQKNAVDSGFWPLFRYDPRLREQGLSPLQLDSKEPTISIGQFMENETRFKIAKRVNPERYEALVKEAEAQVKRKYAYYKHLTQFK
jgi:pyruvate-ferredoxin/flavodoxin oxidoreductase